MPTYNARAEEQLSSFTRGLEAKARVGYTKVTDRTKEVLKAASWLDVETFGLKPTDPVYEVGTAHGMGPASSHLVSPTELGSEGRISPLPSEWTQAQLGARETAVPGFKEALGDPSLPRQSTVGGQILDQMRGRDLIVQNLNFESRFMEQRLPAGGLDLWAREANLELRGTDPRSNRLYATDANTQQRIADAKWVGDRGPATIQGKNLTQRYVDKWADVYTKGYSEAFFGETGKRARAAGQTRVFDQLDITRSVFALAQQKGAIPLTGELSAGIGIEAFARASYGVGEFHGAAHDVHMQRDLFASTLNIGEKLKAGEALAKPEKEFLNRIATLQQSAKETSVRKRLTTAYLGLKESEAGLREGALEGQLQRKVDIKYYNREQLAHTPLGDANVTVRGVGYRAAGQPAVGEGKTALAAMDDVLAGFKDYHAQSPSNLKIDHDAIFREVRAAVMDPFEAEQARLTRATPGLSARDAIQGAYRSDAVGTGRAAIAEMHTPRLRGDAITTTEKISENISTAKGFMKAHWGKIGVGVAALAFLNNMSSSDDKYNVIEGLPESGLSSQRRKYNSEFGSGYQGPNPWLHPEYNVAEDTEKYRLGRASSMGKTYQQHLKSFTEKDEVPEWVTATGSAGTALHRIEAAQMLDRGEIAAAEEFIHDPVHQITGHIDLTLEGGVPADIKTVSEGRFRQVKRRGPFDKHVSQLNFYMYMKGADRGFLEYVSREDPENKRHRAWVPYDPELLRRDIGRMEAARSTVRRGAALGVYPEAEMQKGADIHRLTEAAKEEVGETERDIGQIGYLKDVFAEEMEYLQEAKARSGKRRWKTPAGPSKFSGKDDAYNTIEAFRHEGIAGLTRSIYGFGSGWLGLEGEGEGLVGNARLRFRTLRTWRGGITPTEAASLQRSQEVMRSRSLSALGSFSGKDDAYNTIEAFGHVGLAALTRPDYGFGSGWVGIREGVQDVVRRIRTNVSSPKVTQPSVVDEAVANISAIYAAQKPFAAKSPLWISRLSPEELASIDAAVARELGALETQAVKRARGLPRLNPEEVTSIDAAVARELHAIESAGQSARVDHWGLTQKELASVDAAATRELHATEVLADLGVRGALPAPSRAGGIAIGSASKEEALLERLMNTAYYRSKAAEIKYPLFPHRPPKSGSTLLETSGKRAKLTLNENQALKAAKTKDISDIGGASDKTFPWAPVGVGAVAGAGGLMYLFSGSDDSFNTIKGFQEKGVGKAQRRNFGSGYVIDRKTIPVPRRSPRDRYRKTRLNTGHRAAVNSLMRSMHRKNINTSYRG